jgi:hypothetical protein
MNSRRIALAVFVAAVLLSPVFNVEACGPFFEPEVFVNRSSPDDLFAFDQGHLGILQDHFDSNDYAVAYRYLIGGKLSVAEGNTGTPPPPPQPGVVHDYRNMTPDQVRAAQEAQKQEELNRQPAGKWLLERARYLPPADLAANPVKFPTDYSGTIVFDQNYLNCPNPAFTNAAITLNKRAATWEHENSALLDWIRGQDAVFANCDGKSASIPAAAPAGSPPLLIADRAYQIASATFYAQQYPEAAQKFEAIAQDKESPWSKWGEYLAARATVREAFAMGKKTDPYSGDLATYDDATMHRAQKMLESLLAQPNPEPSKTIVQTELNFIRIRTEPEARAAEICAALAGPASDQNFDNDLNDLSWILVRHTNIEHPAPLLAWINAWRGNMSPSEALATWQQNHALPWLVMALVKADPSDASAPTLINEAAKIAPDSPAYDTVFFHRVRLLTATHHADEARALLDARLPALLHAKPNSMLNALLGERMAVARDFPEFLTYAPRTALSTGSEGAEDLRTQCNEQQHARNAPADCPALKSPSEFDEDAADVLNRNTPIAHLIEAASSTTLPANLRTEIALMAWTRAVMLQDEASAAKLAPLLPQSIRDTAGSSVGFPADLAILRNPAIRPYLEDGVPRVASFATFDSYRNNWWCKPWDKQYGYQPNPPPEPPAPSFVPPAQASLTAAEYSRLQQLPGPVALLGQRIIEYAKDHPDDPHLPEALALTVRASHYGCESYDPSPNSPAKAESAAASKAAFEILHRRFPNSPWTAKTPYYY